MKRFALLLVLVGLTTLKAQTAPLPLQRITAYNASAAQTDSTPELSSCGPTQANQIALSQDLFFEGGVKHLCGRRATIVTDDGREFHGVINDTMNRRYTSSADILFSSYNEAVNFGVRRGRIIVH